ncbi:MAG TPA: pyrroloquinoline quinone biosynthesis protein PqqE [Afifellaceae bacterium]|nr:pyrroloquinoline quinone biosynthesis protein PqqE [Afifellaceae bacterium]
MAASGPPIGVLAELTHRCPLQCPYCSNPAKLLKADRELDTETWLDVFEQAADIGIMQVHISGGEPALRADLEEIVDGLAKRGTYSNLITAAVTLSEDRVGKLAERGLDHIQISLQGARPETTELIGRYKGGHEKKLAVARWARQAGLPLTINAPIHRHNIEEVSEFIELALSLDADRLEIANVQYLGWAYLNRSALMPERDQIARQIEIVEAAREKWRGILNIDFVAPDYFADFPKPCMGGWAFDAFTIAPDGKVLPCHAAQTITGLQFDNVTEHRLEDIWQNSSALNKFRGTDWMPEPCRSCERKTIDFGGCRCQAFAITGNAAATDPACIKSPDHGRMQAIAESMSTRPAGDFVYRRIGREPAGAKANAG